MNLKRALLLFISTVLLITTSKTQTVTVTSSKPKISKYRMTVGSYSVIDEDPDNLPQLWLGAGVGINVVLPFSESFSEDNTYGLNINGTYRKPGLGEGSLTFNRMTSAFDGTYNFDGTDKPHHTELEAGAMWYLKTYEKQAAESIDLTSFWARGNKVIILYMAKKVPATISYGPRFGLISRNGNYVWLGENAAVTKYNNGTLYFGFGRTKRVRQVINFTNIGICSSNRTVNYFADVMFAPMLKENSMMRYDSINGQIYVGQVSKPFDPTKIPIGWRVGVTHFFGNHRGNYGATGSFELGWRPTYGQRSNGFYLGYSYRITLGLMGNTPKYPKALKGKKNKDPYYDYDWYIEQRKQEREVYKANKKAGVKTIPTEPIRIDAGSQNAQGEKEIAAKKAGDEITDSKMEKSKDSKSKTSKKKKKKLSPKKQKKKNKKAKAKSAKAVKKARKKTSKYKRRSFVGQLIHGKNSKKTLQKSRFG